MVELQTIRTFRDLKFYQTAFSLAMEVFELIKQYPKEETYSLVDQLRRSSRSIVSNIREGYAKRRYENVFIRHLNDALGSSEETRTWLEFSQACSYISEEQYRKLEQSYNEVSAMLYKLMENWKKFDDSSDL